MQTTLPERSLVIKERLDIIVQEILAAGKSKILQKITEKICLEKLSQE